MTTEATEARDTDAKAEPIVARARLRAVNLHDLVIRDAVVKWRRNLRTGVPAMGAMIVLLWLAAVIGILGFALNGVAQDQAGRRLTLHVYLKDGADQAQIDSLRDRLRTDGRVLSVRYVSKQDALADARAQPGVGDILAHAVGNPIPASFVVDARDPGQVSRLAGELSADPAVDPAYPTSHEGDTYQALWTLMRVGAAFSLLLLLVLGLVTGAVLANSIRAAILARGDEMTFMRQVGASQWVVRGPAQVEGALTGTAAGLAAAVILVLCYVLVRAAGAATSASFLPGVGWDAVIGFGVMAVIAGLAIALLAVSAGLRAARA
jgi:cell division transport system permease protein